MRPLLIVGLAVTLLVISEFSHIEASHNPDEGNSDNGILKTGLEFLGNMSPKTLNTSFFFSANMADVRSQFRVTELVRMFIGNLKGYPVKFEKTDISKLGIQHWLDPYRLAELVERELHFYRYIVTYFQDKRKEIPRALTSYLVDIQESSLMAFQYWKISKPSPDGLNKEIDPFLFVASHPLLNYRLLRRYVDDFPYILLYLRNVQRVGIIPNYATPDPERAPALANLRDAWNSIYRLQIFHSVSTTHLNRGILGNLEMRSGLNALNILEIGAYLLEQRHFDLAVLWIHRGLEALTQGDGRGQRTHPHILQFFQNLFEGAVKEHNDNFLEISSRLFRPAVLNSTVTLPFHRKHYKRQVNQLYDRALELRNFTEWGWAMDLNFQRLCSGERLQSDKERLHLRCWYYIPHKYWTIGPLKAELLNTKPDLVQIYDFLGDQLMRQMKRWAAPRLERSQIVNRNFEFDDNLSLDMRLTRTSSHKWLGEEWYGANFLKKYTTKLEFLTGLKVFGQQSSEPYQLATYGPSQHYYLHLDAFANPKKDVSLYSRNRIVTVMGYISNVEGGRTAFPILGTFTEPVKGSVVMWTNIKKDGVTVDGRTKHGGCPVLHGIKWIVNKWITYGNNVFTFPCGLDPEE